ncbi:MAG: hypothetical protein MRY74_05360 [Neomegalonema sp.]|nr:hypothetical protein [Neomegalonema sp.]
MRKVVGVTAMLVALAAAHGSGAETPPKKCFDKGALTYADCPAAAKAPIEAPAIAKPAVLTEFVLDLSFGGVNTNTVSASSDRLEKNIARIAGLARANLALGGGFALQLDIGGEANLGYAAFNPFGAHEYGGAGLIGGHLNWRDDAWLLGAFAGAGKIMVHTSGFKPIAPKGTDDYNKSETGYIVGAEAQAFLGDFTLYGQFGFFKSSENDTEVLSDAKFGRLAGSFYLTENTVFGAEFLYGEGEERDSVTGDLTFWGWGATVRHRGFADGIDMFARYSASAVKIDDTDPDKATEHFVMLGLSLRLGAEDGLTLKESHRRGVALDLPLAPFRATGYTSDVVD